jgi:hypothetical protein
LYLQNLLLLLPLLLQLLHKNQLMQRNRQVLLLLKNQLQPLQPVLVLENQLLVHRFPLLVENQ